MVGNFYLLRLAEIKVKSVLMFTIKYTPFENIYINREFRMNNKLEISSDKIPE